MTTFSGQAMNAPETPASPRLTQLSHGGGCGCKIAPGVLQTILARSGGALPLPKALLVGIETCDDAAVYQINETQAIVATTDFFMPIVDDPFDFGRIAATNALSDIYAMGATPLFALAVVGMPLNRLDMETIRLILAGGEAVCTAIGIPVAGGHSIDSVEPIYGLVGIGLVDPRHLKKNSGARPGDKLILGKPLGVGIYSAALRKEKLAAADYATLIDSTTRLNTPGAALACLDGVHALTDVTGFGLLGHLLEICRGSAVSAHIDLAAVPVFPGVVEYARQGFVTGASARNWSSYGAAVVAVAGLGAGLGDIERALLCDPQKSGGLLVACAPELVTEVLSIFMQQGFEHAAVIGEVDELSPAAGGELRHIVVS